MVNGILGTSTIPNATGSTAADASRFAEDFDDFLNLAVVQLQNQDPLEPQDSNEFTNQIVQFTSVEQQINTNTRLDTLIESFASTQSTGLVSYTGRTVETEGSLITLQPPVANAEGEAEQQPVSFAYELEEEAANVIVTIRNVAGDVVFNGEGPNNAGRNVVTWDGINNDGGFEEPGSYQAIVTSVDDEGEGTGITTFVTGQVQGVNFAGDEPTFVVNGEEIPTDAIRFVTN